MSLGNLLSTLKGSCFGYVGFKQTFCTQLDIWGWALAGELQCHLESVSTQVNLAHCAMAHLGLGQVTYHQDIDPSSGMFVLVSNNPFFLAKALELLIDQHIVYL